MSRSKNSRRGTRAAIQRRPTFGEGVRRRLGAPTAQACRAVQAANDAISSEPGDPRCGSCHLDFWDDSDESSCPGCGRPCFFIGTFRLDADDSEHDWRACLATNERQAS